MNFRYDRLRVPNFRRVSDERGVWRTGEGIEGASEKEAGRLPDGRSFTKSDIALHRMAQCMWGVRFAMAMFIISSHRENKGRDGWTREKDSDGIITKKASPSNSGENQ